MALNNQQQRRVQRNGQYWQDRFEQLESAANQDASVLYDSLERQYTQAQRTIERQIESWYQRFANNNEISMAEARQWLTSRELAEFQWDIKEYIKYGELNSMNPTWMKQLENASARYHISRLEALKYQTQQSIEVLYGNQIDSVDDLIKGIYSEGYYHTAYEVQKGFNIGWNIASIDQGKLEKIISKPWVADSKNFSERIWGNKTKLINEVHNELTQMCILGRSPDEAIKNLAKKMNTSRYNTGRLVMTEAAYFHSVSQKDAFNELNVEKFEVVATLDNRTSEICQAMDGHIEDMKNYQPGVTAPPFHVWCRSCTVPYFDDNFGERAARGADGKTYYVPSDMKYPEWKAKFVGLQDSSNGSTINGWQGLDYSSTYTKQEAINRLRDEYGISFQDSRKYPMDGELMNDCVGWMDSFSTKYTEFMQNNPCQIPTIINKAPSTMNRALGYYRYYPSNNRVVELALNGKYHTDPLAFQRYIERAIESQWCPANANIRHTFMHEFGHHVSNSMKHITRNSSWEHDFISECIQEFKTVNSSYQYNTYVGMGDFVSRYGATSESELFAEAFSEYFGGENPREFATIFGEKLETLLEGVK